MKKTLAMSLLAFVFASCSDAVMGTYHERWQSLTFYSAESAGDRVTVKAGSLSFNMIYANTHDSISFPIQTADDLADTVTTKFFIGETEVTNGLYAVVLQWALENGKISETGADNLVSASTVMYGNRILIDLGYDPTYMKISYSPSSNKFSVADGYSDHPVVLVTWYGAVIFCNWLTEMVFGDTDNLVYEGITSSWNYSDTVENSSAKGFRLPLGKEWEFAARYRGSDATNSVGGSFASPANGLYWTTGSSASGAIDVYTNETASRAVAWYSGDPSGSGLQRSATKSANSLGIYDMSGSVWEWCFLVDANVPVRGGSWNNDNSDLQIGAVSTYIPTAYDTPLGFRIVKSR